MLKLSFHFVQIIIFNDKVLLFIDNLYIFKKKIYYFNFYIKIINRADLKLDL